VSAAITSKQMAFVEAYLTTGFNATQAASLAGYKGNRATLASIGYENLRKPHLCAILEERMDEIAMSPQEVKARLSILAVPVDVASYYDFEYFETKSGLKKVLVPDLDRIKKDGLGSRIKRIYQSSWGVTIEWHDPSDALEKLNRIQGSYVKNQEEEKNYSILVLDVDEIEGN
jgi:hypothetical protein